MSASSILPARSLIAKLTLSDTQKLAAEAVNQQTSEQVQELVAAYVNNLTSPAASH
ncbi:hypothetical protein D3C73_1615090 [compost metagenome]